MGVVIFCVGRGLKSRVLSLVFYYGPVSGASFDDERRVMFDGLSTHLGSLSFHLVWVVGVTSMQRLVLEG